MPPTEPPTPPLTRTHLNTTLQIKAWANVFLRLEEMTSQEAEELLKVSYVRVHPHANTSTTAGTTPLHTHEHTLKCEHSHTQRAYARAEEYTSASIHGRGHATQMDSL